MKLFSQRTGRLHTNTLNDGVPAKASAIPWRHLGVLCAICVLQITMATASAAPGASGTEPGLLDIYRNALHNNAGYQAALAQYQAAIEAKPQARSRLLPKVNASAAYNEIDQSVEGKILANQRIDKSESFNRYGYGISLTQPLYNREAFIGLDKADIKVHQARLKLQAKRSKLAMKAAKAYFEYVNAYNRLKFVREEKHAIKEQLKQIRTKAEAGLVSNADLKAARARYDLAVADEISAQNALKVARIQLKTLTGQRYASVQMLPLNAPLPPLKPEKIQPWVDAALQYNTKLRIKRANAQLAELKIDTAKASRWPDLDLVASYTAYDQSGGLFTSQGRAGANEGDNATIGVKLSVPIFNGGMITSEVNQAVSNHAQQKALLQQKRIEIIAGTRTAILNISKDKARVKALDQAIESAKAAVHAAKVGYDVGTSTSTDVLDALRKLYQAYRDYALARSQYLADLLKLKHVAGQLDKGALAAIDRSLS